MKRKRESSPPLPATPYFDDEGVFHPRIVSPDAPEVVQLAPLSPRMITFLTRFETSCYLDCCGFSALSFKPATEWDKRWNFQPETMKAIQLEIENARELDAEIIHIRQLQQSFYKEDWLLLLEYFAENMEKSKHWK